jgi:hypothetical protein
MVRVAFTVSGILFLVALLSSGCSHSSAETKATSQQVEITVHPWKRAVRFVGKTPPKTHYLFIGRVRGEAPDSDFVDAVKQARKQILDRAEAIGADLVKLDTVAPSSRNHAVMLAGRAYRSLD